MSHPAMMFEIVALDQGKLVEFYTSVFGWQNVSQEGFAFFRFAPASSELLGVIATATIGKPGWDKGVTFYIQVDNLEKMLDKIEAHGGTIIASPIAVDRYHFRFAMFADPEQNILGLIERSAHDHPA